MPEALPPAPSLALAYRAYERGEAAVVLEMAEQAERRQGAEPAWKTLEGVALSMLNMPQRALLVYQWLCSHEPGNPVHWSNLGNCLCELGREDEALVPLQKALLQGATESALHFGLARAYAADGQLEMARRHIEGAIERAPEDAEFHLYKLRILQALDRWPEAVVCADYLRSISLDEGQTVDFGYLLFRGQWYERALECFQKTPTDPDLFLDSRIGLVMAYERTNRMAQAKAIQYGLHERDMQHNAKLLANFLQMQAKMAMRDKDFDAARSGFERILHHTRNDAGLKLGLEFEYAAALDKCRQPAAAMAVLQRAHAERRTLTGRTHRGLQDSSDAFAVLEQPLPPWNPACHGRDMHTDPVFVVGFPRSGTTLLEQLLDAHPALASFDEQPFLQHIVQRLNAGGDDVFQRIRQLGREQWHQQREAYFTEIRSLVPDPGRRAVDKNPLNMVRLPLLQNFFPQAQVILAVRHPCDVVLSCYMQHFRAPAFAITFESLESTARMYGRVFSHWQQSASSLQLPVLVWKYEDLVAETEARARALFEFLHLPWHAELLAFTERAKDKGAIKTPSYTQVVEPVNAGAVGRWQAYKDYFTPAVMEPLKPWLERFGYSA
jgi:tetratricopeptide (TPR) repeat protein